MREITKNEFINSRDVNTIFEWTYNNMIWCGTYRIKTGGDFECYSNDRGEWMDDFEDNIHNYNKRFYVRE
jgi:hypothetical protein